MHTTVYKDTRFHHNGDFSGDIRIVRDGREMEVPFKDILALVARFVRDERIAVLEQATPREILGLGKEPSP